MSTHHTANGGAQAGPQFRALKQKLTYELERNASDTGAFADVYQARFGDWITHMKHGCGRGTQIVAKVLRLNQGELQRAAHPRMMVQREVELHQNSRHENVARLFDYALNNMHGAASWENFEMATLFIEKLDRPLHIYKQEHPDVGNYVAAFLQDMTSGLAYIHSKGIIHRDISTRNLMVKLATPENGLERDVFKIIDFGLSRHFLTEDAPLSSLGGTKGFMAPEVLLLSKDEMHQPAELHEMVHAHEGHGRDIVSAKVDVYSLGAVLHELLLGFPPSAKGGEIARVNALAALRHAPKDVNPSNVMAVILQSMLQRRPEARPHAEDLKILVAAYHIMRRDRRAVLRRLGLDPTHPTVRNIQLDDLRASTEAVVERHVDLWQTTRVFDAHLLVRDLAAMLSLNAMKTVSVMDFETLESRIVILYPAEDYTGYKVAMLKERLARQWGEDTDRFCLVLVQRHAWLLGAAAHDHLLDDLFRGLPTSDLPSCCFHTGTTVRLVVVRDTRAHDDPDGDDQSEFEVITRPTEIRERDIDVEFASLLSKIKDKTEAWDQILRRVCSLEQQWSDLTRLYEICRAKGGRKNEELEAIFEANAPLFQQLIGDSITSPGSRMAVLFSLCEQRIRHAHSEHDTDRIGPELKQELAALFQQLEREANAWYRDNAPIIPALRALALAEEAWEKYYADGDGAVAPSSSFIEFIDPSSSVPAPALDSLPDVLDEQTSDDDDEVVLVEKPAAEAEQHQEEEAEQGQDQQGQEEQQEQQEQQEGAVGQTEAVHEEQETDEQEQEGERQNDAEQQQQQGEGEAAAATTTTTTTTPVSASKHEQLVKLVQELTRNKNTLEYSRKQLKHQLEHAMAGLQRLQREARQQAKEASRTMRELEDMRREKQAAAERITELQHELAEAQGPHARDASPDSMATQLREMFLANRRLKEEKEALELDCERKIQELKLELSSLKRAGSSTIVESL